MTFKEKILKGLKEKDGQITTAFQYSLVILFTVLFTRACTVELPTETTNFTFNHKTYATCLAVQLEPHQFMVDCTEK